MVILRTDGAKAYDSKEVQIFCEKHRIKQEYSAANSSQQNGIVKSNIRTIMRMAQAMKKHAKLPESFAGYDIQYAVVIYNSISTKGLQEATMPEQRPDMSKFRVFGCKCWNHIAEPNGKFGD